jgi:DNA-binding phage protein
LTRNIDGIKIDTMNDVRKKIREIIRTKGTIREVAEEIGIAHSNLIRMLRESQDPRIKTIERIVDQLGYSLTLKRKEVTKDKQGPSKSRR